jgi:phosphatidate cytidylyltransferase
MLKLRVLTALLLAPLSVAAILLLPSSWFALILGIIFCLGAWEWTGLARIEYRVMRHLYVAVFVVLLIALFDEATLYQIMVPISAAAALWWLVALAFIVIYPRGSALWSTFPSTVSFAGVFSLLPAWIAMVGLHAVVGHGYVLLLVCLIWGADIGAYFAGHAFGRRKLAPQVSPGKTWAGVAGALVAAALIALAGAWLLQLPTRDCPTLLIVSLLAVAASVVGDLTESMFKRLAGVKDSGNLLPGHGGMLDRIDSLIAAAPIFVLGLLWQTLL